MMNDFIENSQKCVKLTGLFRGKVLKHLSHGKLKVYVPGIYDSSYETKPDMLPDAEQMTPLFGGGNYGNGCFSYPNIGTIVVCTFLNGDLNLPIVLGATLGSDLSKHRYSEVAFGMDELSGTPPASIHMINSGKSKVKLYEGGQIEMQVAGTNGSSNITLDTNGNIFMLCSDTLQILAKDIKIEASNRYDASSGDDYTTTAGDQVVIQGKTVNINTTEGHTVIRNSIDQVGKVF